MGEYKSQFSIDKDRGEISYSIWYHRPKGAGDPICIAVHNGLPFKDAEALHSLLGAALEEYTRTVSRSDR